jgi:DNA-binding MarR family transcriptional regulator
MTATREELLQTLIDRMYSVMRLVRHNSMPSVPVLSPPHAHVLFTIFLKKNGVSVKELAEIIGVTPGAITQFVNHLFERDLVVRDADPNDRRIVRIKVSRKAKDEMEQLRKDSLASASQLFQAVNDDEIQQIVEILSRIDTTPLPKHRDNHEEEPINHS